MVNYKKHNIEILIRFVFQLVILRIQQSRVRGRFCLVGCFDSKLMISVPYLLFFCCIGPILRGFPLVKTKTTYFVLQSSLGFTMPRLSICPLLLLRYREVYWEWGTFTLDCVNCLELVLRRNANYIERLINLLKFSPNLETLLSDREK